MDNEAKIRQLEEELEISKAEGRSAAEIGMKLLQANEDIREQIQKDSKVYEEQIEVLKTSIIIIHLYYYYPTATQREEGIVLAFDSYIFRLFYIHNVAKRMLMQRSRILTVNL